MIGWLILAAVLALCAVLCIRAARFKPEAGAGAAPTPVAVDTEGAAQRLAQLVRIPTVSNMMRKSLMKHSLKASVRSCGNCTPAYMRCARPCASPTRVCCFTGKEKAAPLPLS